MTKTIPTLLAVGLSILCSACSAENGVPQFDWQKECVGRLSIDLPGPSDVATNPIKAILREYDSPSPQPAFAFPDGQSAGWSAISYLGTMLISGPTDEKTHDIVRTRAEQEVTRYKNWALRNKKNGAVFERLSTAPHLGVASRVNASARTTLLIGDLVLYNSWLAPKSSWDNEKNDYRMLIEGTLRRQIGDVPSRSGVCLPGLFIADDGKTPYSVGTTYRLKAHPDITIWLEDAGAVSPGPDQNPAKFTPQAQSDFFWTQDYGPSQRESVTSYWSPPYRPRELSGSRGVESFVELVRADDTKDFGYLAVTAGNPDAADKPQIMLYVIRDAKNAKLKGVEPVGKEEFLKMARAIADSVKLRPTSP